MALIQVNFVSDSLRRTVPLNVVLPVDKIFGPGQHKEELKPFKTLYLMHGIFGNYTDWVAFTRIQRWAEEHCLAVVMPSGDNSFYVDQPINNNNYGRFIGEELPLATRRMFRLSDKREDTFIGGLSMGGFGALRNGLKYNDTFGRIVALSSAMSIFERPLDDPNRNTLGEDFSFGNIFEAVKTDKNPRVSAERLGALKKSGEKVNMPKIYMACGTSDPLLESNRIYRDLLIENGFDLTYEEGEGAHNWIFWDTYMHKVMEEWLPLGEAVAGINSGNVK